MQVVLIAGHDFDTSQHYNSAHEVIQLAALKEIAKKLPTTPEELLQVLRSKS